MARSTVSRRWIMVAAGTLALVGTGVALSRNPVGRALLKPKSGFLPVETDHRVFVEAGAEERASLVAFFLPQAIALIEGSQGRPFKKPFRVYVCATQGSLNEFIGLPPGAPIRGTVRFGEVFLAPSAFDWRGEDLHRESLLHELSHLHLRQQLGFLASRGNIPSWFHEGLADLVSGAGGEGISDEEARQAILGGPTLQPDSTGSLWSLRSVTDQGLRGPMFHKQSRMFLAYLESRDPGGFHAFLLQLQEEKELAGPFRAAFGAGVGEVWEEFRTALQGP